ncbi:MAG: flagellar biosynthetic protein FliO [Pseudomonadota bacterium]
MMGRWLSALLLVCALAAACAHAQAVASSPAPVASAPAAPVLQGRPATPVPAAQPIPGAPSPGGLLQTIFALTLVLGLLAGLAWLMKRFGPRGGPGAGVLRIVGALNLGGRERIMVLEVGDQWIVVGASPGRVNALATLPRPEGAPVTAAAAHPDFPAAGSFAAWLKQTIDQRNAK